MKGVPSLAAEPSALAAWRAEHPDDDGADGPDAKGAWDRFKDSKGAYIALLHALLACQQGLCGYCEQRLSKSDGTLVVNDYQVEHVAAKSSGSGRTLDWQNLMLCCGGGTWAHHTDESRHLPKRGTLSCGQAKGDSEIDTDCDPRRLDWREPLVLVGLEGDIRVNEDACRRANIDPDRLEQTLKLLDLNCERLKLARRSVADNIRQWVIEIWGESLAASPNLTNAEAGDILQMYAGGRLRPDAHGHLTRFWTTERLYLGGPAEAWIRNNARVLRFPE